jgi:hypothetical protein
MPSTITPQFLLEGAVLALEQCGLLLRDANVLYRGGRLMHERPADPDLVYKTGT